ncbi:macrolide 2'-phosphotransferase [Brevibacterium jeotgali]|uniref:Macrolide phosphotransferase n=1 Tax=Brevibacterium jeotgali TaxID=1262550 RepID=A0A2H1L849_9MICO|nr:macrolide 2'-phosphotransferase [Brevibacterium jeotgali]TWC03480.1 macrolide phosphotransferase [Brevibacterium jeotgali]SMY12910.1 macrolide phosphotransferase [Brevibacterium jeotgali]
MDGSLNDLSHTAHRIASDHGLDLDPTTITVNEMGLDFRVVIARTVTGDWWTLRFPRRPDVLGRADVENRLLRRVAPHLSVSVPDWRIHSPDLIAYPLLPGEPGLTLTEQGEPRWHTDVSSDAYSETLGDFLSELHGIDPAEVTGTGIEVRTPAQEREKWREDIDRVAAEFEVAEHLTRRWDAWLQEDSYWPQWSVLTHGEIYPAHTLVVDDAITAVLDWTTAAVGDPARDFVFHRVSASPNAFAQTVTRYGAAGGRVWPRFADHCTEMFSANAVGYGLYAVETGDPAHREAAAAQLNPVP